MVTKIIAYTEQQEWQLTVICPIHDLHGYGSGVLVEDKLRSEFLRVVLDRKHFQPSQ